MQTEPAKEIFGGTLSGTTGIILISAELLFLSETNPLLFFSF